MDTANRSRLQQQPRRFSDRQQQQSSGSREFQPRKSRSSDRSDRPAGQMGEGSYEATRDYEDNMKDVQAAELKKAEEEGMSHSRAPGQ